MFEKFCWGVLAVSGIIGVGLILGVVFVIIAAFSSEGE